MPSSAWAVIVLVACAVAVTVALVVALLALRKAAVRAESVLGLVEQELRPLVNEVEALLGEMHALSRRANVEIERVSGVVTYAEQVARTAARMAQAVGGLTRVGQTVALLAGLRRGVGVFMRRLKRP